MAQTMTITIAEARTLAAAHLRAGRSDDAERLCNGILARFPKDPVANRLIGVLNYQKGVFSYGVTFLRNAMRNDLENAETAEVLNLCIKGMQPPFQGGTFTS